MKNLPKALVPLLVLALLGCSEKETEATPEQESAPPHDLQLFYNRVNHCETS